MGSFRGDRRVFHAGDFGSGFRVGWTDYKKKLLGGRNKRDKRERIKVMLIFTSSCFEFKGQMVDDEKTF